MTMMEEIDELTALMKNVVLTSKGASSRFKGEMDQRVRTSLGFASKPAKNLVCEAVRLVEEGASARVPSLRVMYTLTL